MNCNFKTIETNKHKCSRCGYILIAQIQDISKLHKMCDVKPGIIEKAGNLTKSMVKFAKNRFKTVSTKEQKRRLDICTGTEDTPKCEFFNNRDCDQCGCMISLKSQIESEHCPVGKW